MSVELPTEYVTILFSDIESSTRLWEEDGGRMSQALAAHDALAREAVEGNRGVLVKLTGDGVHAVFPDPLDALNGTLMMQRSLAKANATHGVSLQVRCGLHIGMAEKRANDYFGTAVNRAARISAAAHGGQILASRAVVDRLREQLPHRIGLRDLGIVRLRDLNSSEHVFQVLDPELRQDFPTLRSLESTPNNLPKLLTSLVGRDLDLAETARLIRGTRLLTLTGPGGIGKTRLSLHLGADLLEEFPDGVWFIELAAIGDPELVPQAIASVLKVQEDAGIPLPLTLASHLENLRTLVILDNCEHLIQASAEVAGALLRRTAHLKILTSSREALRIAGELLYPVAGLSVPARGPLATSEVLAHHGAMHLFIDRAAARRPTFRLTDQNAEAVAAICRRLDGIPLAIELAAARIRALSVEEIASRLTDRFGLLSQGDPTALPRQQTLRALIDWSYDLLSENEQMVLWRLSVFAGGWSLGAAESVLADDAIRQAGILDLLERLVDKSLAAMEEDGTRYRLLETVRQYAQERLESSGEELAIRSRHVDFYLQLAKLASPELVGPNRAQWLAKLDLERENLLAAHAWCGQLLDRAQSGLELASSLRRYWMTRGLFGLGLRLTIEALERPGAELRTLARWDALFDAGQMGGWMGRYAEAQSYLEESLSIARENKDAQKIAHVLQPLGLAALGQGNFASARRYFEEGLALARELGDQRELAAALNALAQLYRAQGDIAHAEPLYDNVLALARALGDRESIAIALLNLAMVAVDQGSADRARLRLREASVLADELQSQPLDQSILEVCAGLRAFLGDWSEAGRLFGVIQAQTARTGLHRDPADEAFLMPLMARARAALGDNAFAQHEGAGLDLPFGEVMAETKLWLADQDR